MVMDLVSQCFVLFPALDGSPNVGETSCNIGVDDTQAGVASGLKTKPLSAEERTGLTSMFDEIRTISQSLSRTTHLVRS